MYLYIFAWKNKEGAWDKRNIVILTAQTVDGARQKLRHRGLTVRDDATETEGLEWYSGPFINDDELLVQFVAG